MDDLLVLPGRVIEAQRIYQELQNMTEAMHITDAIITYLQSWEFFSLVVVFTLYRAALNIFKYLKETE